MSVLEGHTVVETREMTDDEYERMAWHKEVAGGPQVLVLDDGKVVYPVCNSEGSDAGAFHLHGTGFVNDLSQFEGATITSVAPMSDAYMDHLRWGDRAGFKSVVISFDNGESLYTARDSEGNEYGLLNYFENGEAYRIEFERIEA